MVSHVDHSTSCKLQGVHGGGLSPEAVRLFTLAIKPTLTYGAHAIHLTNADLQSMERTHARIVKNSFGLSKFSRTSPLLAALNTQGVESVIKVQTPLNLMSGDSLASTFYWIRYKRGETGGKTLMGRSHTIMKQYVLTLTKDILSDIFLSQKQNCHNYMIDIPMDKNNGLVDSLRAIFNDYIIVIKVMLIITLVMFYYNFISFINVLLIEAQIYLK